MNKPLTVSLEGIGHCVLRPDILFPLQSSPHTLHSSCPPNTTSSWAGEHWGPSPPQPCTHLEATGFCHVSYPMHQRIKVRRALTCLGFAKCVWQLSYDRCCLPQIPSNAAENMKSPWLTCSTPAGWLGSCCAARTWKSYSLPSSSAVSTQRWTRDKFTSFWFYILSLPFSRVRWVPHAVLIVILLFPFPVFILPWEGHRLLLVTSENCSGIYFPPFFSFKLNRLFSFYSLGQASGLLIASARISKLQLPSMISQANKGWIHFQNLLGGRTPVCFFLAGIWSKTERTEGAAFIPFIWRRVTKQGLDGRLSKLNERFLKKHCIKCPSWEREQLLCFIVKGGGMSVRLVHIY